MLEIFVKYLIFILYWWIFDQNWIHLLYFLCIWYILNRYLNLFSTFNLISPLSLGLILEFLEERSKWQWSHLSPSFYWSYFFFAKPFHLNSFLSLIFLQDKRNQILSISQSFLSHFSGSSSRIVFVHLTHPDGSRINACWTLFHFTFHSVHLQLRLQSIS